MHGKILPVKRREDYTENIGVCSINIYLSCGRRLWPLRYISARDLCIFSNYLDCMTVIDAQHQVGRRGKIIVGYRREGISRALRKIENAPSSMVALILRHLFVLCWGRAHAAALLAEMGW